MKKRETSFLRSWALVVSLLIFIGSFTACSGNNGPTQTSGAETSGSEASGAVATSAQAPSQELEVLKVGVSDLPGQMDPMRNVGNTGIRIHYNIFETLILADQKDNYNLKPMLAESWKRIDDYTLEFKLKKGIKFHNGAELKASDVKFSFDRLKEKDLPDIELAASLMSVIKEVQVVDDYTLRVISEAVDPILEDRIASSWGGWILPEAYVKEAGNDGFALKPVGTGPFKVVSYSPEKVVLERFEDYWGEKPNVKRIEYILYPENSTRLTALINGEVDLITQLPADQISVIEKDPNLEALSLNIANMHVLMYNTSSAPLSDKKLRQALNLGIDRQLLADTLWGGKAVVPRGHQYPEYADMYFADYPVMGYNVEKAKQLVAESSYKGEELQYEVEPGYYTFNVEAGEAVVDMWKQIGVNAKVVFKDKQDRSQISTWSNSMRFPDPAGGLWLLWGPGTTPDKLTWPGLTPEFTAAGKELASIIDTDRRKVLARKLMEIWDDEAPGTLLYYPFESWGIRKGLQWQPYSSQAMDFRAGNFKVK